MPRRYSAFLEAFRSACEAKELRYPRCARCCEPLAYTQKLCPAHPEMEPEWVVASGRAILHSIVEYRLGYSDAVPAPYLVAQVELEEGPRLIATIRAQNGPVTVGTAVAAQFEGGRLVFKP